MIREHPDWILLDDTGSPLVFDKWYGGVCLIDPSVPGVRDYLERLCQVVFREWGYEGVKLDFSSFAFEDKRVRFRYHDRTAAELEHWLVDTFRRYLPTDGFFGWCVVCGTGSPFMRHELLAALLESGPTGVRARRDILVSVNRQKRPFIYKRLPIKPSFVSPASDKSTASPAGHWIQAFDNYDNYHLTRPVQ